MGVGGDRATNWAVRVDAGGLGGGDSARAGDLSNES